ncbi:MAG: DUF2169 domain-containing protein, partial [Deltaproteobacteria bacterium]|nr:DUF2169 domain-containing protein [Deltaproteobacteria bacterium]MBW2536674.1 DUF2169 domain-containing protein [Deltaproteobacteria bacterium]
MDVESLGSLPVGSLWWRFGDKPWTLSVISKGTLELTPGELRLAARQDPVVTLERFAGGDRNASLYAASDLAPLRPNVDLSVVGLAYAPGGEPVKQLTARFQIGPLEKSLVIHGEDRSSPSGAKPFTTVPLRYELAPGGPGTANPVGVAPNSEGAPARMQRASGRSTSGGDDLPPIGCGPIPAHWPGRRRLLKGRPVPAQPSSGGELTLPPDFDLRYYNAAPSDQQLKKLEPGTPIVLENLHPVHGMLRTRLPKISPQVFVLRNDGERIEQLATIDSLWIDTERSVAVVNWRAQLELGERSALRRVWVVITEAGKRLTWDKLAKLVDTLGAPLNKPLRNKSQRPPPPKHRPKASERPAGPAPWPVSERNSTRTTSVQVGKSMREHHDDESDRLNETQAIRLQPAKSRATPFEEETQTEITTTASVLVEMRRDGTPPWLAPGAAPAP